MTRNRPPKLVLFICICMYYKTKGQIPLASWENKTHKLKRSIRDISALSLRHLYNKIAISTKGNALKIKFNGRDLELPLKSFSL